MFSSSSEHSKIRIEWYIVFNEKKKIATIKL